MSLCSTHPVNLLGDRAIIGPAGIEPITNEAKTMRTMLAFQFGLKQRDAFRGRTQKINTCRRGQGSADRRSGLERSPCDQDKTPSRGIDKGASAQARIFRPAQMRGHAADRWPPAATARESACNARRIAKVARATMAPASLCRGNRIRRRQVVAPATYATGSPPFAALPFSLTVVPRALPSEPSREFLGGSLVAGEGLEPPTPGL
jgi:hypothetical protein